MTSPSSALWDRSDSDVGPDIDQDVEWKPNKQAKLIFAVLMVLSLMVAIDSTILVPALLVRSLRESGYWLEFASSTTCEGDVVMQPY